MTSRRGFFGLIAGALGLAAGIKAPAYAEGGIVTADGLSPVGLIPSEQFLPVTYDMAAAEGDSAGIAYLTGTFDLSAFENLWANYVIHPTLMYCNPRTAAHIRASIEVGRLDLFGIRVRRLTDKYAREYEAIEPFDGDDV